MLKDLAPNRIKLTVAYDGTSYHGWQLQHGVATIEGVLNHALSELLDEKITVIGASRTDSGVHALCNIAVFDTKTLIPAEKISYALNQRLPDDIRIQHSEAVEVDFHPRRVNSRKTYEYRILSADFPLPTKRLYHHFTYRPLDVERMQSAAAYLVGEHDFASFCAASAAPLLLGENTVRTIYSASVEAFAKAKYCAQTEVSCRSLRPPSREAGPKAERELGRSATNQGWREISPSERCVPLPRPSEIIISVTGNGFLYNMVRIIAGTLIDIGIGKYPPEKMAEILAAKDRSQAGPTASPRGLTLVKYEFLDRDESKVSFPPSPT